MPRIPICFLAFAALCLLSPILCAQGYDTKFKAIGYKPGDVYHTDENVSVSLNGGGLEIAIPLGPAIPGPVPLRPVLNFHGKLTQSLNRRQPTVPIGRDPNTYMRWTPPSLPSSTIHPGKLYLTLGADAQGGRPIMWGDDSGSSIVAVTPPNGIRSEYFGGGSGMKEFTTADASELTALMTSLVSSAEWPYASTWGSSATGTAAYRTSDHSTLIFGPHDHRIYWSWDFYTNPDGTRRDQFVWIPSQILQVREDQIILWQQSRNVYKPTRNDQTTVAEQWWWRGTVYHPVWIKSRSGFKVNVEVYRGAPKESADLVDRGLLTGWKMSYIANGQPVGFTVDSTSAAPVTFFGMAGTPSPTGVGFSGATPARVTAYSPGWQPGTTEGYETLGSERQYDVEYMSDEMSAGFSTLAQGSLTTTAEWNGTAGLISKLVTPRGKIYQFTYDIKQGAGVSPPSGATPGAWTYYAPAGKMEFWSVVTQMDVIDAANSTATSTRSTKYQWAIPTPQTLQYSTPYPWGWSTKHQGVAQTLPDGQTVLTVFSAVPDSAIPGAPALDFTARTFMAQRQSVAARYYYASGDISWQGFFASTPVDPSTTNWFKRERMEGWDLRAWAGILSAVTPNVEPRPTRIMTELRGGPVSVTESDDWDPTNNQYRVKRTYVLAPGTSPATQQWAPGSMDGLGGGASYQITPGLMETPISGALAHAVNATTFVLPREGLFARPDQVQEKQLLAPASGAVGAISAAKYVYDTTPGLAHVVLQKIQLASDGSAGQTSLNYASTPEGLFTKDRLKSVTVQGSAPNQAISGSLSGLVGATYGYSGGTVDGIGDATGRFMTLIQPTGVSWTEQELAHDGLGRPLSQTDPNGFTPTYAWDAIGHLTGVTPPNAEVSTTVAYPSFGGQNLRQASVARGATTSRYYYNAYGELIGEDRLGAGSTYSHRTFAYDSGGRKTFDSIWRPGAFTAVQSADWMTPGTETVTAAWTENVCTATIYDPDLGQRVCIQWSTVYHPAVTQAIQGTFHVYDIQGRRIRTTTPNGEVTETRYDIGGNPLITHRVVAPGTTKQTITAFERDVLGRLAKVTDALGQVTSYGYDQAGRIRLVQQADAGGHVQTRSWTYDGLGRLVVLDQPESGATYFTSFTVTGKPTETVYGLPRDWRPADVNGRDASAFSASGAKVLSSGYDTLGRPTSMSGPGVNQAFTYDTATNGKGKLASATSEGVGRSLQYLGLNGRLSSVARTVDGLTFVQNLGYDAYGKLTSRGYPNHANPGLAGPVQSITYDDARSLPAASSMDAASLLTLGYDPTSWAPVQMTWANGGASSFTYRPDQVGLATMAHTIPGQAGASWAYSYDELGLLTTDGEDYYTYDPLGRLTSAFVRDPFNTSVNQGMLQQFGYDGFGNRSSLDSKVVTNWTAGAAPPGSPLTTAIVGTRLKDVQTYGFNALDAALWSRNQLPATTLTGVPTGALYDVQGNLVRIYRAIGDSAAQITLSYDALGRVSSLGDSTHATSQTYGYDDEGLRIKITDSQTGVTTYNIYNEARQLIATFTKIGSSLTWKKDIFYIGTKEVAEVDALGTEITLVDHLGSPRLAWRGSGAPMKQKYLPFGESLDPTSVATFGKGFTNHEQTDASGLIYMQARFYLPMFGRFGSPDPARDQHFEQTQSWNIYSYVQNNPTMKIDPAGLAEENPEAASKAKQQGEDKKAAGEQAAKDEVKNAQTNVVAGTAAAVPAAAPGFGTWLLNGLRTAAAVVGEAALPVLVLVLQVSDASPNHHKAEAKDSSPDVPKDLVGTQDDKSGRQGKRHNSGPLAPEHGGTGDAAKDFGKLTGGKSRPAPSDSTLPPGSRIGDNKIQIRPGKPGEGSRIDIPASGSKPIETLHYPE